MRPQPEKSLFFHTSSRGRCPGTYSLNLPWVLLQLVSAVETEFYRACAGIYCIILTRISRYMHTKLQVMKFGGTSVGDAACIRRSAQIVANASREYSLAVLGSATSGGTNRLVDAGHQAKRGDREACKTPGYPFRRQQLE